MKWEFIIQLILKILDAIMNKDQKEELEAKLKAAAKSYGGTPEGLAGENCRVLLEKVYDKSRGRPFKRAWLRWAMDEVPPAANKAKPALTKAQLSEGKTLVDADGD